jgi:hypothetical protein
MIFRCIDLHLLVADDRGSAGWVAPYLFEAIDARIPPYWEFQSFTMFESERWDPGSICDSAQSGWPSARR